jgi:MoxR-like ATPase
MNPGPSDAAAAAEREIADFRATYALLRDTIARVIVGQTAVVDAALVTLFAGGHLLLEGAPGTGKTLLVRTLSKALALSFGRIQCTPDVMPADIVGTHWVAEEGGRREYRFRKGPVFANVVLADELNRATPKTQSALLEAMEERQVTVGGETLPLPAPFLVLATENPIEMEGTYPLPEAQLDRFLLKALVPNPTAADMESILDRNAGATIPEIGTVLDGRRVLEMQALVRRVVLGDRVRAYVARLVEATRPDAPSPSPRVKRFVRFGASARAALALVLSGKVAALASGRGHVAREDVRAFAASALRHRLVLNFEAEAEGVTTDGVLADVLTHVGEG